MIVEFEKSFEKSLERIKNKNLYPKIEKLIIQCESSVSISNIAQVKKLVGYNNYYRIRIGEYRIGFELVKNDTIRFILIAHRKEIYKFFPK